MFLAQSLHQHAADGEDVGRHQRASSKGKNDMEAGCAPDEDDGKRGCEGGGEEEGVNGGVDGSVAAADPAGESGDNVSGRHGMELEIAGPVRSEDTHGNPRSRAKAMVNRDVDAMAVVVIMASRARTTTANPVVIAVLRTACRKT